MGGKVEWRSDGVGSNVDTLGGLTCVEELVGRSVVGRGVLDRTGKEAADRRSSSMASGCGVLECTVSPPVLLLAC